MKIGKDSFICIFAMKTWVNGTFLWTHKKVNIWNNVSQNNKKCWRLKVYLRKLNKYRKKWETFFQLYIIQMQYDLNATPSNALQLKLVIKLCYKTLLNPVIIFIQAYELVLASISICINQIEWIYYIKNNYSKCTAKKAYWREKSNNMWNNAPNLWNLLFNLQLPTK